jgi:hypothetical protein
MEVEIMVRSKSSWKSLEAISIEAQSPSLQLSPDADLFLAGLLAGPSSPFW